MYQKLLDPPKSPDFDSSSPLLIRGVRGDLQVLGITRKSFQTPSKVGGGKVEIIGECLKNQSSVYQPEKDDSQKNSV
ncbi:hypothetical protein A4S05_10390 [Nostoc sp. KVJ20]|nr:hypothetical protein A4S05_10390 [Nostoc sp. KVJ20]